MRTWCLPCNARHLKRIWTCVIFRYYHQIMKGTGTLLVMLFYKENFKLWDACNRRLYPLSRHTRNMFWIYRNLLYLKCPTSFCLHIFPTILISLKWPFGAYTDDKVHALLELPLIFLKHVTDIQMWTDQTLVSELMQYEILSSYMVWIEMTYIEQKHE